MNKKQKTYLLIALSILLLIVLILFGLSFRKEKEIGTNTPGSTVSATVGEENISVVPGGPEYFAPTETFVERPGLNTTKSLASGTTEAASQFFSASENATYTVSDDKIASIDANGNITASSYGTVTVTATYTDETGTHNEEVTVTVYPPEINVSLDTGAMVICSEKAVNVPFFVTDLSGADVSSVAEIHWYSANPEIATVDDNGTITAHKNGVTAITVTIDCGEKIGYGFPLTVDFLPEEELKEVHTHLFETQDDVAASCTKAGKLSYRCECGEEQTTKFNALGHDYQLVKTVEAECEKDGYTSYTCSRCKDSYKTEIKATGHSYKETGFVDAGCTTDGHYSYICTQCDKSYQVVVPAQGHNYAYHTYFESSHGLVTGEHEKYCTVCGIYTKEDCVYDAGGKCVYCKYKPIY